MDIIFLYLCEEFVSTEYLIKFIYTFGLCIILNFRIITLADKDIISDLFLNRGASDCRTAEWKWQD